MSWLMLSGGRTADGAALAFHFCPRRLLGPLVRDIEARARRPALPGVQGQAARGPGAVGRLRRVRRRRRVGGSPPVPTRPVRLPRARLPSSPVAGPARADPPTARRRPEDGRRPLAVGEAAHVAVEVRRALAVRGGPSGSGRRRRDGGRFLHVPGGVLMSNYVNAADVLPPMLLLQIQVHCSGSLLWVPSTRRRRDPARDQAILDLHSEGLALRAIAQRVGLTAEGVRLALIRQGVADIQPDIRRQQKLDRHQAIIRFRHEGLSLRRIAQRVGLTAEGVRKVLIRQGHQSSDGAI